MKRGIQILLFIIIIILLYMLFLSIRQGMREQGKNDLMRIERTNENTNR
jgi:uncharacterized membrane protein affecting hemolysin expression